MATAKSQAQISPSPPPKALPFTRATMGRLQRSIARNSSATGLSKRPGSSANGEPSAVGLSAPPAQKVLSPAPVMTIARTPGWDSAAFSAATSSCITTSVMVLCCAARSMVTTQAGPRASTRTWVNAGLLLMTTPAARRR